VLIGDVARKLSILSDTTYNADWIAGTPSADAGADTITLASHGLANGDPIEFDAGTGALPGGITNYDNDFKGGTYYNVINRSGDTFQITATVGSTAPVDITSAGTAGFRIRKAGISSITISGLNLASDLQYEIFIRSGIAKITTAANTNIFTINNDASQRCFSGSALFSFSFNSFFYNLQASIDFKYSYILERMMITRIDATSCQILDNCMGFETNNKSAVNALQPYTTNNVIYSENLAAEVTNIVMTTNNVAQALIRNGTRIIIYKR
jgi:hypothetical protein